MVIDKSQFGTESSNTETLSNSDMLTKSRSGHQHLKTKHKYEYVYSKFIFKYSSKFK